MCVIYHLTSNFRLHWATYLNTFVTSKASEIMTRNNYEAIPSSYPEDEDETRSPDSDNSNALRPKIDFKKRTASIIVLVASVACIAFLATFKGSSQSTFQRNNLPEGKSSFSQIIGSACLSVALQK